MFMIDRKMKNDPIKGIDEIKKVIDFKLKVNKENFFFFKLIKMLKGSSLVLYKETIKGSSLKELPLSRISSCFD